MSKLVSIAIIAAGIALAAIIVAAMLSSAHHKADKTDRIHTINTVR